MQKVLTQRTQHFYSRFINICFMTVTKLHNFWIEVGVPCLYQWMKKRSKWTWLSASEWRLFCTNKSQLPELLSWIYHKLLCCWRFCYSFACPLKLCLLIGTIRTCLRQVLVFIIFFALSKKSLSWTLLKCLF